MNQPVIQHSISSRRDFLRQSAFAGAAGYLASSMPAFGQTGSEKKIRIGIAGGGFGLNFYWNKHPNCIVQAVTDLREDRRKRLMQVYQCDKSYPSLEEMVKDPDIDAIAVFTEGPNHYKHTVLAMDHGKHVISACPVVMGYSAEEGLDQAHRLLEKVRQTGLTYMTAETSMWSQTAITVRKLYQDGELGEIISCDADYLHPGLRELYGTADKPTWRYGVPPMFYPTHCTAYLVGLTGETLTHVSCTGWGNEDPICKKNAYNNPFWNETAHFRTSKGNACRVRVWWEAAVWSTENATWYGTRKTIDRKTIEGRERRIWSQENQLGKDDAGFAHKAAKMTRLEEKEWWNTDMLPEGMRLNSGHHGSHAFIAHEFIDSLVNNRKPVTDIIAALNFAVPGIVAHQSSLKDGELLKIPQFGA